MTTDTRPVFQTWTKGKHNTGIQWTHLPGYLGETWNPTTGCERVSAGCDHCYAFTLHDQRFVVNLEAARAYSRAHGLVPVAPLTLPEQMQMLRELDARNKAAETGVDKHVLFGPQYDRPFSTVQLLDDHRLLEPLRTKRPRCYFVDSMADLFHDDVPDEFIDRVFAVMALSPQHVFQILTKRPERMRDYLTHASGTIAEVNGYSWRAHKIQQAIVALDDANLLRGAFDSINWYAPLPNVWLGVSVEDQQHADERVPVLLDTPAAIRFLSCEPLLGEVMLGGAGPTWLHTHDRAHDTARIDWVIVGGESGPGARRFDLAWARELVRQCRSSSAAVFVKQLGGVPTDETHRVPAGRGYPSAQAAMTYRDEPQPIKLRHSHGSNMEEWPAELQIREFPIAVDA